LNSYVRMLKMIRPYLPQAVAAVIFLILFAFFSLFSITLLSPFIKALFLDETLTGSVDAVAPLAETAQGAAGFFSNLKTQFLSWAESSLLRGTKQEQLLRICLTFFGMVLLKNLTGYVSEVLMTFVGEKVVRDLRNALYLKFTSLPLGFFHQNKAGELISRSTNDVLMAQKCIGVSFTTLVRDPIYIIMALGIALVISWKMTIMAFVLLPISLGIIIRIGKGLRGISHRQQEEMAILTTNLQESVYGMRVIKSFAMEDFENDKFLARSDALFRQIFRFNRIMKMSSPLSEQISMVVGLFLLWYGGTRVFTGGLMSPDQFLVFLFAIFSMVRPIKNLGQVNNEIQAGVAAADRIFMILDQDDEVRNRAAGHRLEPARGQIALHDVRFSYVAGEPVLRGITLQVEPGEIVALVGSSGGGKSTLMDMIPGFYHPDSGQVKIDGHDLHDLNLAALRRNMGIVTQEVILFHDTIRNNIAYGLSDVPLDDVRAAARAANADDFIMGLPKGYDTVIGDRGLKVSGGQRQRLSIARAILRNPPILLLDEATSALDTESEQLVQEAIDRLMQDRTTVVIAHRLSTIQNVDRIYLLEKGEVVQVGTHAELLAAGGRYKELYELQFKS